jgi:hypothetical protein
LIDECLRRDDLTCEEEGVNIAPWTIDNVLGTV